MGDLSESAATLSGSTLCGALEDILQFIEVLYHRRRLRSNIGYVTPAGVRLRRSAARR